MTSPLINGLNKRGACQNHGQRETGSWEKKGHVPLQRELNKHGEKRERAVSVSDISSPGILLYEET